MILENPGFGRRGRAVLRDARLRKGTPYALSFLEQIVQTGYASMKPAISKDQAAELRRWLERQRVPAETIELLLSSQHAANTYKAYRMKKQIVSPDGWAINFGANWARKLEKDGPDKAGKREQAEPAAAAKAGASEDSDIKRIGQGFFSRTFMGLAEKLKQLQIEDVDKPVMQKIALEVDKDHLAILKKLAAEKKTTVGNLIRVAIRDFIEKNG